MVNWKNLKASVRDVYFGEVNLKNTAIKYKMASSTSKKTHWSKNWHGDRHNKIRKTTEAETEN